MERTSQSVSKIDPVVAKLVLEYDNHTNISVMFNRPIISSFINNSARAIVILNMRNVSYSWKILKASSNQNHIIFLVSLGL